jgi:hypothetical protein
LSVDFEYTISLKFAPRQRANESWFFDHRYGWWRSPVAHLHGVQGVASSNLVHPTKKRVFDSLFYFKQVDWQASKTRSPSKQTAAGRRGTNTKYYLKTKQQIYFGALPCGCSDPERKRVKWGFQPMSA